MIRKSYESGTLQILLSEEEEARLQEILSRPKRAKYLSNSKLPCSFDRLLLDIGSYTGEAKS